MPDTIPPGPLTSETRRALENRRRQIYHLTMSRRCTQDVWDRAGKISASLSELLESTGTTEVQGVEALAKVDAALEAGAMENTPPAKPTPAPVLVRHPTLGWVPEGGQ